MSIPSFTLLELFELLLPFRILKFSGFVLGSLKSRCGKCDETGERPFGGGDTLIRMGCSCNSMFDGLPPLSILLL